MTPPIHLATICLERNRWGSRQPSFRVGQWLDRFAADGFAGIELWENHFLAADADEQARLIARAAPIAVFNTYAGFGDTPAEAEQRARAAEGIAQLKAKAVKYNLGSDTAALDTGRRNLVAWAEQLPPDCRPLCECHPGTALEEVDAAARFFADLDPARFGIIAHLRDEPASLERWLTTFGPRLCHVHMQMRTPEDDPTTPTGRERLAVGVARLKQHDYRGSVSVEFTRGIGREEQIEALYHNARVDRAAFHELWQAI